MKILMLALDHPRTSATVLTVLALPAAVLLVRRGVERAIGRGASMGGGWA